jgi:hypothetical protein
MGMRAAFVTALSAVLLIYADLLDWPAYAIVGLVFVSAALVALSAKKYSQWAAGLVVSCLLACDAFSRSGQTELSALHSSVSLGDLAYASCVFAIIGWVCGYFVRAKHALPEGKMQIYNPPPTAFVISPALNRRRLPRASHQ